MRIATIVLMLLAGGCCYGQPGDEHERSAHERVLAAWIEYGLPEPIGCGEVTYTRVETEEQAEALCTEAMACYRPCGNVIYPEGYDVELEHEILHALSECAFNDSDHDHERVEVWDGIAIVLVIMRLEDRDREE